MRRLECDICLQDLEGYYDTTVDIIDHNQMLLAMAAGTPHGAKVLSTGRVVILRDGVSRRRFVKQRAGVAYRKFSFPSISGLTLRCCLKLHRIFPREPRCTGSWQWWIPLPNLRKMVIVNPARKLMIDATDPVLNCSLLVPRLDKDARAVVPWWSHNPEELLVDQPDYELTRVPLTSISLVTTRTIKVKRRSVLNTIVERSNAYMSFTANLMVYAGSFRWSRTQSWNTISSIPCERPLGFSRKS